MLIKLLESTSINLRINLCKDPKSHSTHGLIQLVGHDEIIAAFPYAANVIEKGGVCSQLLVMARTVSFRVCPLFC
jgi:hypothetical protein